jgi:UTP--glucose-1-phosphate uridylyltransferase
MKCVLTVAGLGTRLLPLTKEIPKEMMPIYSLSENKKLLLKPILQVIFESLYDFNIRDFCFIVGRTKRAVEDHFTVNNELIDFLKKQKKKELAKEIFSFSNKLEKSDISFTYQPKPIGFGDSIQRSKKFVGKDNFLLHAGDDIVISQKNNHLKRLEKNFKKYNADIACLIEEVDNPSQYGVVNGPILEKGVLKITEMKEKPKKPKTKFAIIAIYIFKPNIFNYLEKAKKKSISEQQLAEAFNLAIKNKAQVIGVILRENEKRIDIGTPEKYSQVLNSLNK